MGWREAWWWCLCACVFDCFGKHFQVESLDGAEHLLNDNAHVPRVTSVRTEISRVVMFNTTT